MTVTTRSGIPTTYRSGRFRSRLEARWANFFDLVGWSWVYEPIDCDGYIPDFLIQGPRPFFVEVGPCIVAADYDEKAEKPDVAVRELGHDLLVVGVSPVAPVSVEGPGSIAVGLLGEYISGHAPQNCPDLWLTEDLGSSTPCDHGPIYSWAAGIWAWCFDRWAMAYRAPHLAVFHAIQDYQHRPCADGREQALDNRHLLEDLWARAGAKTQWRP